MKYNDIVEGIFMERPNRFIAYVMIAGVQETVHVKNTGRCKELLLPGVTVYLEKSANPDRKTKYDLIAVQKGESLINMDSQAPNKVVEEWLYTKQLFDDLVFVRPEKKFEESRFDFYVETKKEKIFIEVKGVTLEDNNIVKFPDAPSQRAVKHVHELIKATRLGYKTFIIFVIQMEKAIYFTPNNETHQEFAEALQLAKENGVTILAYDCNVKKDELTIRKEVPVFLNLKEILGIGKLPDIPKPLLSWYDNNRRILPWREEPAPYRVWVSEIMLQQTRVEAAKPYFHRFMETLPSIEALANAQEEVLLKLWEGLGYYNRVRNLQKAAKQIMEEYHGNMPDTYDELLKLKGIGSYTAGAISSIAFQRAVPAVDGNVLRVISRVRMDERFISDGKVKKEVEEDLLEIIPKDRPGDFNQAMMELGAMVCIPNGAPHCMKCPLSKICMAYKYDKISDYPQKASKKDRVVEEKTVLIIQDANKAALNKRPSKGLLAGMYEFPCLEGYRTAEEVITYLEKNGLQILRIQELETSKHIFTHKEWHMHGYCIRVDELALNIKKRECKNWNFSLPEDTKNQYPIPSAFSAYVPYLNIKLGKNNF